MNTENEWLEHCRECQWYDKWCTSERTPPDMKPELVVMWYQHQDTRDDIRCWNAYCFVYDKAAIVPLEPEPVVLTPEQEFRAYWQDHANDLDPSDTDSAYSAARTAFLSARKLPKR